MAVETEGMTHRELRTLFRLLVDFDDRDFGDLPAFVAGRWSRDNLAAMIEDLERIAPLNPASPI